MEGVNDHLHINRSRTSAQISRASKGISNPTRVTLLRDGLQLVLTITRSKSGQR